MPFCNGLTFSTTTKHGNKTSSAVTIDLGAGRALGFLPAGAAASQAACYPELERAIAANFPKIELATSANAARARAQRQRNR